MPTGKVQPANLPTVFASTGSSAYAIRLQTLAAPAATGFLKGSIDCLCEHEGKYYVLDWKSNVLGATDSDYTMETMQAAMDESHYTLQYHLYLLALHRQLRAHLPDYDYDRHVGGACFVFLRGINHTTRGVFLDVPPKKRMEDLDRWVDGTL
jgi:exodeoxyribonuclease V beta subunit